MSSQETPTPGHSRKGSLTRAFSRLKRSMTKRSSRVQSPTASEPIVEPTKSSASSPPAPSATRFGPEILEIDETPEQSAPVPPIGNILVPAHRHQSVQTRLTVLGDEMGINVQHLGLDIFQDGPRPGVLRVKKKIRMRVHYTCHNCEARFGPSKICSKCDHSRCRDCPRDPPKKSKEWAAPADTSAPSASKDVAHQSPLPEPARLTPEPLVQRSSQPSGMPVQRVQYECHECATPFMIGTAHYCPNCGHQRCNNCSFQLARPTQPPADLTQMITLEHQKSEQTQKRRVWKTPRQRVRWSCHECQTTFQQGGRVCSVCKHTRCDDCTRLPPKPRKSTASQLVAEASASLS